MAKKVKEKVDTVKKEQVTIKKAGLNATHRLELAEAQVESLQQQVMAFNNNFKMLADEIDRQRELIIGIGRRVNAVIQAAEQGQVSSDSVNGLIILDNIAKLRNQVEQLIEIGALSASESITTNSFIVGRELDVNKVEVNPRLQLSVTSLTKEMIPLFIGKKVGESVVTNEADGTSFEVTEVYQINSSEVKADPAQDEEIAKEA